MSSEDIYIKKRKRKAFRLSVLFLMMRLLPVRPNKIVFATFEGDGGFGCNPRYIAEELHRRKNDIEMVWLTHDPNRVFPPYIRAVKDSELAEAFHLATAKVWVDNYRKPLGTLKRKGQFYLQTWHASIGFKAVGLFRGERFPKIARLVSEWDSNLIDYVLSNSDYCDKIYPKKLLYDGPTLRTGSPRCDCIINNREQLRESVRSRYQIKQEKRILLYAPTFRGGTQREKKSVEMEAPSLDYQSIKSALEMRFGGEWIFFLRLHPQIASVFKDVSTEKKNELLIDVSQADDMSELIAASDMLITDYSSCAFDAAFCGIPALLYAGDLKSYVVQRGEMMWEKEELPFTIAETNDALILNIKEFDERLYEEHVKEFMKKQGIIEDGHASERVVDIIEEWIADED